MCLWVPNMLPPVLMRMTGKNQVAQTHRIQNISPYHQTFDLLEEECIVPQEIDLKSYRTWQRLRHIPFAH
jgi:hypothetical protein